MKVFVLVWQLSDKIDTATKGERTIGDGHTNTHSKCPLQNSLVAARNSTKTNGPQQRHRHIHTHIQYTEIAHKHTQI